MFPRSRLSSVEFLWFTLVPSTLQKLSEDGAASAELIMVGDGPRGPPRRGGDTLLKVDVAAVVALPAENVFWWSLLNGDRSSVWLWFWQ